MSHPGTIPAHFLEIVIHWIHRHCVVPDGDSAGDPFVTTLDHRVWLANWYSVKKRARPEDKRQAFVYRAGLWIAAQKVGKSPAMASEALVEFLGPVRFAGWAKGGEVYKCEANHCTCGWEYTYRKGEAMGRPWATPRIQLAAVAEDQVENTWGALQSMVRFGPLGKLGVLKPNEDLVRHPNGYRDAVIEVVTSKAQTRLGARITAAKCDEIGLWNDHNSMTKFWRTMQRGAGGMGGRMSATTNPYDPGENSQAQRLRDSKAKDIYVHYFPPPPELDFEVLKDRMEIIRFNYQWSPWVNPKDINADAEDLINQGEPAEAERFFGNRVKAGSKAFLQEQQWETKKAILTVKPRTAVCGGFDGSDSGDWTGIRLETLDFHQFTPTYFNGKRPAIWDPSEWNDRIPRREVHEAWKDIANQFELVRVYLDPPFWSTEIDEWQGLYGEKVFIPWYTNQQAKMWNALERYKTDVLEKDTGFTHDDDPVTRAHVQNAVQLPRGLDLATGRMRYIIGKASDSRKIDLTMSSVLAHEATTDAVSAGAREVANQYSQAWL